MRGPSNMGDRGGAGASRPSLQHPSLVRSKAGGTYAAYLADGGGGVPLWRSSAERANASAGVPARRLEAAAAGYDGDSFVPLAAPRADEPALPLAALHTAGRRAGPGSRHGRRHALDSEEEGEGGVKMYQVQKLDDCTPSAPRKPHKKLARELISGPGVVPVNSIFDSFCPGVA